MMRRSLPDFDFLSAFSSASGSHLTASLDVSSLAPNSFCCSRLVTRLVDAPPFAALDP